MTERVDLLQIGGGLASARAVEEMKNEGAGGKIIIISAENLSAHLCSPLSENSAKRVLRKVLAN